MLDHLRALFLLIRRLLISLKLGTAEFKLHIRALLSSLIDHNYFTGAGLSASS